MSSPPPASRPSRPSPLNPSATLPTTTAGSPSPLSSSPPKPFPARPRGHSTSTIKPPLTSQSPSFPRRERLLSVQDAPGSPEAVDDGTPRSSFRERSRSPNDPSSSSPRSARTQTPPNEPPSSWWGNNELVPRPWRDPGPKRKKTVPEEQTEGWVHTRQRVAQAAASVLGTTGDIVHEALFLSADFLEFAPIPGLEAAAKTLLNIWDALQLVDMNRLACLRLTERCAEILFSVRQEVKDAGDTVGSELAAPITKLVESFTDVHTFLQKQIHRPFLKRYLKRDEILAQINGCRAGLEEALGMFSLSIQIRILKQVQAAERSRAADAKALMESMMRVAAKEGLPASSSHTSQLVTSTEELSMSTVTVRPPPPYSPKSPSMLPPSEILPTLLDLHSAQNLIDAQRDLADLRRLMRDAVGTSSDVEMLGVLQIGREEMPEAIKTLQRALERVVEREGAAAGVEVEEIVEEKTEKVGEGEKGGNEKPKGKAKWTGMVGRRISLKEPAKPKPVARSGSGSGASKSSTSGSGSDEGWGRDTLDREFIESGIDALRRMSRGVDTTLPSWTITRYEVDRDQKIGIGFFSDVYRGTWRGRTVAIKVLAPTTPRQLFIREVGIWKGLRHENVLELYGASSACGDPPWFFVSPYMGNGSLVEFLKKVGAGTVGGAAAAIGEEPVGLGLSFGAGVAAGTGTGRGRPAGTFPVWRGGGAGNRSPSIRRVTEEGPVTREGDLFRFMLEIAKGMKYLHMNGVLHGDLKAANILVDDKIRCVISDFGQSEMKSEAYRISGTPPPHGTLRWQAPELMSGQSQLSLTPEMDVYSYAISCIEILTMGRMPWPLMDDEAVRHFVLKEDTRPPIPNTRFNTPALQELLRACWHRDPEMRPSFEQIVKDVKAIRKAFITNLNSAAQIQEGAPDASEERLVLSPIAAAKERQYELQWEWEGHRSRPSPDMAPVALPSDEGHTVREGYGFGTSPDSTATDGSFSTAQEDVSGETYHHHHHHHSTHTPTRPSYPPHPASDPGHITSPPHSSPPLHSPLAHELSHLSHLEDAVTSTSRIRMPEPVLYTPSSRASSLFTHTPSSHSLTDGELQDMAMIVPHPAFEGYESAPPVDDRIAMMRDERRYRLLLSHQFHPSLTLPLWSPSHVALGAVGYLSKPTGSFVTLFNSFKPEKSTEHEARGLPSLHGYGRVTSGTQRQDKRNAAQRGLDAFVGLLTFRNKGDGTVSQSVSRRYSFPLRAGHKTAHMCTESTMYRYVESLEVPKKWFKANVDAIMQIYGPSHHIQKEDLFLVIGTLDTPDYALFVSHNHPDGQAHFNVFSAPRVGRPWGSFTTDTEVPPELGGPSYDEPVPGNPLSACKVSSTSNGGPWHTVLVARLRFKPDVLEPTSL
ncbi:Dual specificity protein kinase splA [Hypsizygus marmoreus]|uniref:Dual specificity protein kinase splA n=1 Tax=Hypsizygus marmoreus TaxID=39966 RepID=A0A369J852_HYPMA|nr:Dual specificity protein kinase splA [Hypsizygus marmoreus]